MKNIKILLATAIIAAFTLTSCSKDEDNGPVTNGSITAKWNQTKTIITTNGVNQTINYDGNEAGCSKDYIEFTTNNKLNDVVYFKNAEEICTENAATQSSYSKSGNTLTVIGGDYEGTYTITTLSGSELIVKSVETQSGIQFTTNTYFTKAAAN